MSNGLVVEISFRGGRVRGRYFTEGNLVRVRDARGNEQATSLDDMNPEIVARNLLTKIKQAEYR